MERRKIKMFEFTTLSTLLSIKEAKQGIETHFDEKIRVKEAHKQQIITFLEAVIVQLKKEKNRTEE